MVNGLRLGDWFLAHRLRYEHAVIQIALVNRPHIHQTDNQNNTNGIFFLKLTINHRQEHTCTYQNDIERAPAVFHKNGHTHLRQVLQQRSQLLSRNLTQCLHLIIADEVGEKELWHQGKEQGNASRQGK